jgi:hypothetical protein
MLTSNASLVVRKFTTPVRGGGPGIIEDGFGSSQASAIVASVLRVISPLAAYCNWTAHHASIRPTGKTPYQSTRQRVRLSAL